MSRDEIKAIVDALGGLLAALRAADARPQGPRSTATWVYA